MLLFRRLFEKLPLSGKKRNYVTTQVYNRFGIKRIRKPGYSPKKSGLFGICRGIPPDVGRN
jgi:hypothetical protein